MAKRRGNHEGSIRPLDNGRFRAEVMVNGHRASATRDTRRECQDWIRKKLNQRDLGYQPVTGKTKLKDYLSQWMTRHERELRGSTAKQYETKLNTFVVPVIGEKNLDELTLPFIDTFYDRLLADGIGIYSLRFLHRILHKAFEDAVKYDYLLQNPAHGATLPRLPEKEMVILEEGEVSAFLIAAKSSKYEGLFYLATVTGMRQAELFGLRWSDIQWQNGKLLVQRQALPVKGGGIVFQEPKTRAGRRAIKLGEDTLDVLRAHKARQEMDRAIAGTDWQEMGLVFTTSIGTVLNRSNVHKEFKRVLAMANVPDIRFHDLRHTAASILLNAGVPVIVISKMFGHSKVSVTMDIYGHLIPTMQDMATQVMSDLVMPVAIEMENESITRDYARVSLKKAQHPKI